MERVVFLTKSKSQTLSLAFTILPAYTFFRLWVSRLYSPESDHSLDYPTAASYSFVKPSSTLVLTSLRLTLFTSFPCHLSNLRCTVVLVRLHKGLPSSSLAKPLFTHFRVIRNFLQRTSVVKKLLRDSHPTSQP